MKCNVNLSYNKAQEYIKKDLDYNINSNKNIKEYIEWSVNKLYHISKNMNIVKKLDIPDNETHFLVETFMILTNNKVAEYIYKKLPELTILRIHKNNIERTTIDEKKKY